MMGAAPISWTRKCFFSFIVRHRYSEPVYLLSGKRGRGSFVVLDGLFVNMPVSTFRIILMMVFPVVDMKGITFFFFFFFFK